MENDWYKLFLYDLSMAWIEVTFEQTKEEKREKN